MVTEKSIFLLEKHSTKFIFNNQHGWFVYPVFMSKICFVCARYLLFYCTIYMFTDHHLN